MSKIRSTKTRVEMLYPKVLVERIDQYATENMISTRTAAIQELVRLGLSLQSLPADEKEALLKSLQGLQ